MKVNHITQVESSILGFSEIVKRVKAKEGFPESEDGRYVSIRIPGIIEAPNGDLIAYFECRTGGDWSAIDLCCRYSSDGGKVWSERTLLVSGKGRMTLNNPVMFTHGDKMLFLYCEGYKRLFCRVSLDSGHTWREPRELTNDIDAQMGGVFWSNLAPGPGHGLTTSAGRLIVPVWFAVNKTDIYSHHPSIVRTLYSDDGGESWRLGDILPYDGIIDPNESSLCELEDGRIMINTRNMCAEKRRAVAYSSDGGKSFTPMRLCDDLPDPRCMGALCRANDKILFSNCKNENGRKNLTVSTLDELSHARDTFELCPTGGYSDIFYSHRRGRAYVLFECEDCTKICCAEIEV